MYQVRVNSLFCQGLGIALAVTTLLLLASPGLAVAAACPSSKSQPQIEFERLPSTIKLIHTETKAQVAELFVRGKGKPRPSSAGVGVPGGPQTVGLTNAHFSYSSTYTTQATQMPDGSWCLGVSKITVVIGYSRQEVFIPREYRQGTCEYQAVYNHEMEHVAVNRQVLDDHMDRIEWLAMQGLAEIGVITVAKKSDLKKVAKQRVNRALDGIFADFEADRDVRNGALDSEENYHAISALCSAW
jgi:hypothetical protein